MLERIGRGRTLIEEGLHLKMGQLASISADSVPLPFLLRPTFTGVWSSAAFSISTCTQCAFRDRKHPIALFSGGRQAWGSGPLPPAPPPRPASAHSGVTKSGLAQLLYRLATGNVRTRKLRASPTPLPISHRQCERTPPHLKRSSTA